MTDDLAMRSPRLHAEKAVERAIEGLPPRLGRDEYTAHVLVSSEIDPVSSSADQPLCGYRAVR
jgi:hypothetical protein